MAVELGEIFTKRNIQPCSNKVHYLLNILPLAMIDWEFNCMTFLPFLGPLLPDIMRPRYLVHYATYMRIMDFTRGKILDCLKLKFCSLISMILTLYNIIDLEGESLPQILIIRNSKTCISVKLNEES